MKAVGQPRPCLRQWRITLTAELATVPAVRRDVRSVLKDWGWDGARADDLVVICSELVANAIRHASEPGGEVRLRLQELEGDCRIEVLDRRPDLSLPRNCIARDESGRGLLLVRRLADDMDVAASPTTKTVWARLNLAADETTPRSAP